MKRILPVLFITLFLLMLVACKSEQDENTTSEQPEEVEPVANETNDDSTDLSTDSSTNEQLDEESVGIDGEMLIKNALALPTNFEEIIAYPVGPFSGNSYYAKLNGTNSLTDEQLVEAIFNILPAFTEEDLKDPNYLDQWFNALFSLIAEDFRDPQAIMDEFSYEALGKLMINGKPVEFKDQLNVLIILDASGSMENQLNGETMMQIAKNEINSLIDRLPDNVNIGLRIYSGKENGTGGSCDSTKLLQPIASNNKAEIKASLDKVESGGWTPIAESLKQAADDFKQFNSKENTNFIYLISDGMETCEGNPVEEVKKLSSSNIEPIVNVIGFNVDSAGQQQLESIAKQGHGQYIHVSNKQAFTDSMKAIEKIVQAWEKRKNEIIDDAYTTRGKLDDALSNLSKEWDHKLKDQYDALMLIMDELNKSDDYYEDYPELFPDVYSTLLDKISAIDNLYRSELENKYKELMADVDEAYESIINSLE